MLQIRRLLAAVTLLLLAAVPASAFNYGDFRSFTLGARTAVVGLWVDLVQSLSWSTPTYDFGSHDVGTTNTATFTITNSGNDTAEEVATTVTGAGFSLYSSVTFGNISALPGTNTRPVKVKFTPPSAGPFTGFASYSAPNIARVSVALSGTGVGGEPVACSSGTTNQSNLTGTSSYTLSGKTIGQSFTPNTSGTLYAAVFYLATSTGGTMSCRWGNSIDLTTYTEEVTGIVPTVGANTVVFPGHGAVSAGTKYYVACKETSATGAAFFRNTTSDLYAGGDFIYSASAGWPLSAFSPYDLKFEVKLCD